MNVFSSELLGVFVMGDLGPGPTFKIKGNKNTSTEMIAWNKEPFDLSANTDLTFNYSFDSGKTWAPLTVNVTTSAANTAAVRCYEISNALMANATFRELFESSVITDTKSNISFLKVRAKRPREIWKCYVSNASAETKLRFNKYAGLSQLPSYYSRHNINQINNFPDSAGCLLELSNPLAGDDVNIVQESGMSTTVKSDWELLEGKSSVFQFQKITTDGSNGNRTTQVIEYGAGSSVGGLARKTIYVYDGGNTTANPNKVFSIPYVLTSSDLVTPP